MAHEDELSVLGAYLEEHSLKHTKQREVILRAFLDSAGHISSEELYARVKLENPRVGFTTVYRTMKLLVEAGLAQERHFEDGIARYEVQREHHDHLVCLKCGKIVEFGSPSIEKTQAEIAEGFGFRILRHRHELYGHCRDCREE